MIKISKEFKWEMGHRLMEHKGNCSNPHGHSYKMRVILIGEINDVGMVLDYNALEEIVKKVINDFNHCFVINKKDIVMKEFLLKNNFKNIMLPFEPTAENLTHFIGKLIGDKLQMFNNVRSFTIRLYETENVYAEANFAKLKNENEKNGSH